MLLEKLTIRDTFKNWRDKINDIIDAYAKVPATDEGGTLVLSGDTISASKVIIEVPTVFVDEVTFEGEAPIASKLENAVSVNGIAFDGTQDVVNYALCDTEGETSDKVATIVSQNADFRLSEGSSINVRFSHTNTASVDSLTLNVNETGAKALRNVQILSSNEIYSFVYDGEAFVAVTANNEFVGTVSQSQTTTDDEFPILLSPLTDGVTSERTGTLFSSGLTVNPAKKSLTSEGLSVQGSLYVGGDAEFLGNVKIKSSVTVVSELSDDVIDVSTSNVFTKTISGDTTFNIVGAVAGESSIFTLILMNGGDYAVSYPSSVRWANEEVPELTAGGKDVLTFITVDGGVNWYGSPSIMNAS